jgi:heme exporter protein C
MASLRWSTFASPLRFYALSGALLPWCWAVAVLLSLAGLWVGFGIAPSDFQQGNVYRVIFIHVPAAWMAMLLYMVMAFWAAIGWIFNARLASMVARAIAPTGLLMTVIACWTGALWGKPTWGTWWVWDARLTSFFILLLLYVGYIALTAAIDDARRAANAGALLAVIGAHQRGHGAQNGNNHADGDVADDVCLLGLQFRGGVHTCAGHRARARA